MGMAPAVRAPLVDCTATASRSEPLGIRFPVGVPNASHMAFAGSRSHRHGRRIEADRPLVQPVER